MGKRPTRTAKTNKAERRKFTRALLAHPAVGQSKVFGGIDVRDALGSEFGGIGGIGRLLDELVEKEVLLVVPNGPTGGRKYRVAPPPAEVAFVPPPAPAAPTVLVASIPVPAPVVPPPPPPLPAPPAEVVNAAPVKLAGFFKDPTNIRRAVAALQGIGGKEWCSTGAFAQAVRREFGWTEESPSWLHLARALSAAAARSDVPFEHLSPLGVYRLVQTKDSAPVHQPRPTRTTPPVPLMLRQPVTAPAIMMRIDGGTLQGNPDGARALAQVLLGLASRHAA